MRGTIVVLGASNVQMDAGGLIAAALAASGRDAETDVFVAAGHGRSYGEWSRMMRIRGLPGIVDCGLWRALEARRDGAGGLAVLTDLGNDIAYGVSGARLAGWVGTCIERLRGRGMRVAVSRFPAPSVARLGWLRFRLLRALLFPGRGFSLASVLAEGAEFNARLEGLAAASGAAVVALPAQWYGLDRIHLRRSARTLAWSALTEATGEPARGAGASATRPGLRLRGARAELRTVFGRERRCAQPCVGLAAGSTVSFY